MKRIVKVIILIMILLLSVLITASHGQSSMRTVTGIVTKVLDGDSIHLETPEQTVLKIRLYGIDAPETDKVNNRSGIISKPGQPYGEEAKKELEDKVMRKQVKLDILDIDKYRRMVGIVYLDERNINLEMVREGFAEAYIKYLKPPYREKEKFLAAEKEAQTAKSGIWSLPNYERPRDFRKRLKVSGSE